MQICILSVGTRGDASHTLHWGRACMQRARAVGHTLREENGIAQAVRIIEEILAARNIRRITETGQ